MLSKLETVVESDDNELIKDTIAKVVPTYVRNKRTSAKEMAPV